MNAMSPFANALARYCAAYENLTPDTLPELIALFAEDARFKDPFNDARGRDAIEALFLHMFETTEDPRFQVSQAAATGPGALIHWSFSAKVKGLGDWTVEGMTQLVFDEDGLVASHIDHWDAAEQFYERLPVIGGLLRLIKRRLSAS